LFDFYFFFLDDNSKTYGKVMRSIDTPFWKESINKENNSLEKIKFGF